MLNTLTSPALRYTFDFEGISLAAELQGTNLVLFTEEPQPVAHAVKKSIRYVYDVPTPETYVLKAAEDEYQFHPWTILNAVRKMDLAVAAFLAALKPEMHFIAKTLSDRAFVGA